jgi:NAD(P)-dependent dehydrogenase (short-subunit alcohol dehydrogenase family)
MPKTPDYFSGKTIVITGAASGIGRATALIFAREGANVVCADINEAGVKETAEKVNAIGSQALALTIDVTRRARIRQGQHPLPVDLARAGEDRVRRGGRLLAGIAQALPRRHSNGAFWRTGRNRRIGAVHVLGRLPVHDRGHRLRQWRRRLEIDR